MSRPRRLPQIVFLPSQSVLTVLKRVVNPPPLNLSVVGVGRLDQVIGRATRRPFQTLDSTLDRGSAPAGQTLDAARLAKLLQLLVLVSRNVVTTALAGEAQVLVRVGCNTVQGTSQTVVVLGLNVHVGHSVVHRPGARNPVERGRRIPPVEHVSRTVHTYVDLLGDFAMLGVRVAEDVSGRSHEIPDDLQFPHRAEKRAVLTPQCVGEFAGAILSVQSNPCGSDLCGDMRPDPIGRRPLHKATSFRINSLSERM